MEYIYDVIRDNRRVSTTTNVFEIEDVNFDVDHIEYEHDNVRYAIRSYSDFKQHIKDRNIIRVFKSDHKFLCTVSNLTKELFEDGNYVILPDGRTITGIDEMYTYTLYSENSEPFSTTDINQLKDTDFKESYIYVETPYNIGFNIECQEDFDEHWELRAMSRAWSNKESLRNPCEEIPLGTHELPRDNINPSHYQSYCQDLQWLETMQYLPSFREPRAFEAAVELQVRKYLDRLGGKDQGIF